MKAHQLTHKLLTNGFFPDHLTPPFNSNNLVDAYRSILEYLRPLRPTKRKPNGNYPRAKTVRHSVPKRKLSRRFLSIPNPVHHVLVSRIISRNWHNLDHFCAQSTVSLSRPIIGNDRAIEPQIQKRMESRERALRSIGKKFLLKADLTRFYPSIYTHSIPWALHGKEPARKDNSLFGNRVDERIRESQDKQTGGIPIGPDTSFVIAEAVATAIDLAVEKQIGPLSGTRFIDDYHLYFDSYNEAETALAALHEASASLELEINDLKTEIISTPESLEPSWKTELRLRTISTPQDQPSELIDLFSRASALSLQNPYDNVLTFLAKMIVDFNLSERNWPLCEALLLRSSIAEPKILKVLLDIYDRNPKFDADLKSLKLSIEAICLEHGRLQHGNEVLWAMWVARAKGIFLEKKVGEVISNVDDDLVALTALHLDEEGIIAGLDKNFWQQFMHKDYLYSHHWLLAYEASVKGWLQSLNGRDYVESDGFFGILKDHDVSFYDTMATEPEESIGYTDEDDASDFEETPDEDADDDDIQM